VFTLLQWLGERVTMSRYTYINCFDLLTPGCNNINRNQAELLCTKSCLPDSINSGTLTKFTQDIWWKTF